jgi:zinc transport system substrate-binding protein
MKSSCQRFVTLAAVLVAAGCTDSAIDRRSQQPGAPAGPISVCAVNYPLQYFAQRIGGEHVQVSFPAPADVDPAYWTPPAETIAAYQQADRILLNGASYAKWVERASLPPSRVVDTSASFADRYIEIEEAVTHRHGPEGEHSHGRVAFTTWLDPQLAIEQARAVCQALSQGWPEHEAEFEANFRELEKDLKRFDRSVQEALAGLRDMPLIFSHPVYPYFQRRFGLNGESLHWEPDELPSAEQWSQLRQLLRTHPARWMIWEAEPKSETVDRLRELGIASVVFAPCGHRPAEGDFLTTMRQNLDNLKRATLGTADLDEK